MLVNRARAGHESDLPRASGRIVVPNPNAGSAAPPNARLCRAITTSNPPQPSPRVARPPAPPARPRSAVFSRPLVRGGRSAQQFRPPWLRPPPGIIICRRLFPWGPTASFSFRPAIRARPLRPSARQKRGLEGGPFSSRAFSAVPRVPQSLFISSLGPCPAPPRRPPVEPATSPQGSRRGQARTKHTAGRRIRSGLGLTSGTS